MGRLVGLAPDPDQQVPAGLASLHLAAPDLAEAPPQTIAGHRAGPEPGYNQSHPWVARRIVGPDDIQMRQSPASSRTKRVPDVLFPRQPIPARKPFAWRQALPCFDAMRTVSSRRPFLRRRDNTARP